MRRLLRLWHRREGAAAAEMALVAPMLLILLFGSVELGNYFYSEHKLVKAVRDGARFAARQRMTNYASCSGDVPTPGVSGTVNENTKTMVRKGSLNSTDTDLLPNWDDTGTSFSVTMTCVATLTDGGNTMAPSGIYAGMTSGAPAVSVTARLPYQSIIAGGFGVSWSGLNLNASEVAAVAGL
jgi:Flp pilus assembly protein TadG